MKAFKINSKSAIAVITASLSLSIKKKASINERQKIIKSLQRIMFTNLKKYGAHVLQTDTFLFDGIIAIKEIEDADDVQYIEEFDVDVEKIDKESPVVNFSSFLEALFSANGGYEKGETSQNKMKQVLAAIRTGLEKDSRPGNSKSDKEEEICDCPACQLKAAMEDIAKDVAKKN